MMPDAFVQIDPLCTITEKCLDGLDLQFLGGRGYYNRKLVLLQRDERLAAKGMIFHDLYSKGQAYRPAAINVYGRRALFIINVDPGQF